MSELETVWSGNTWRSFPPPTLAERTTIASAPSSSVHRVLTGKENQAKVLACLGDEWMGPRQIADATGLSVTAIRWHLRDAIQAGVVESVERRGATRQRGEGVVWYRRKAAA